MKLLQFGNHGGFRRLALLGGLALASRPTAAAAAASRADGQWQLERLFVGPELGEFPLAAKMGGKAVSMEMRGEEHGPFRMSLKIANTLRFLLTPGESEAGSSSTTQPLRVSMGASTKMMGPPPMMEVERVIAEAIGSVDKWHVQSDSLLLAGPTAELAFRRAEPSTLSDTAVTARAELHAKLDQIKALRNKLRDEGRSKAEVEEQIAPMLEELKALKRQAGPARFEDVRPMPMPTVRTVIGLARR